MKSDRLTNFKHYVSNPFFVLFLILPGCAINPSSQFEDRIIDAGLTKANVKSELFDIVIYKKAKRQSTTLHVYIGGDGSPWIRKRYKAKDPTSISPVILDLIEVDSNNAIILGRPCYHQYGKGRNCDAKWWTSHRYSIEIVDSMVYALKQYLADKNIHNVVLIGFSGGGTLAMLMAEKIKQATQVITINGNLDIDNWTRQNGYTPLFGSLNPVEREPLPEKIKQLHLIGGKDKNIAKTAIIKHYQGLRNVEVKVYPNHTHQCCWSDIWPNTLTLIEQGR